MEKTKPKIKNNKPFKQTKNIFLLKFVKHFNHILITFILGKSIRQNFRTTNNMLIDDYIYITEIQKKNMIVSIDRITKKYNKEKEKIKKKQINKDNIDLKKYKIEV